MELLAGEPVPARDARYAGMTPRAGRGDDHARQPCASPLPRAAVDGQEGVTAHGVRPAAHARRDAASPGATGRASAPGRQRRGHPRGPHRGDAHRAQHLEPQCLLVATVVPGDDDVAGGRLVQVPGGEPGKIGDPVSPADRQGVPAVPPGAPGALLGIEDEQLAPRHQTAANELARRGQPGLPRSDDDDVSDASGISGVCDVPVGLLVVHATIMRHRPGLLLIGAGALARPIAARRSSSIAAPLLTAQRRHSRAGTQRVTARGAAGWRQGGGQGRGGVVRRERAVAEGPGENSGDERRDQAGPHDGGRLRASRLAENDTDLAPCHLCSPLQAPSRHAS